MAEIVPSQPYVETHLCDCGRLIPLDGSPPDKMAEPDSWLQPVLPLYELPPLEGTNMFAEGIIWREDWTEFVMWVGEDSNATWPNSKSFIGSTWQQLAYRRWTALYEDEINGHDKLPVFIQETYGQRSVAEFAVVPKLKDNKWWPADLYRKVDGLRVLTLANEVRRIDGVVNPVPAALLNEPLAMTQIKNRVHTAAGSRTSPAMVELMRSVSKYVLGDDIFEDKKS